MKLVEVTRRREVGSGENRKHVEREGREEEEVEREGRKLS